MDALAEGRHAFEIGAWRDAYAGLSAAAQTPLDVEDIERLAVAAHLVGEEQPSLDAWSQAHRRWLDAGGTGWLARARRLVHELERDCAER